MGIDFIMSAQYIQKYLYLDFSLVISQADSESNVVLEFRPENVSNLTKPQT